MDFNAWVNSTDNSVFGFGIMQYIKPTPLSITIAAVLSLLMLIGMWKIFSKAGIAGWKVLIPFYNTYLVFKLGFGHGWLFLTVLIPYIGPIMAVLAFFYLSASFGKKIGFSVCFMLFPYIFMPILGFSEDPYNGPYAQRKR